MFLTISDLHQGLTRKTGVTIDSLEQFENDKIKDLVELLSQHQDKEVFVAGDLFNSHRVPLNSILQVATALLDHPQAVFIIAGNHDLSKNTLKMSSMTFLSEWLTIHATNVTVIFEPTTLVVGDKRILMVPHMPNQELFNTAIENSAQADILITHCNYENNFAVEKDHSLNMTKEQAKKFKLVISGHEHNSRKVGNVWMVGSFAPCNVSEAAVEKHSHIFDPQKLTMTPVSTKDQVDHYSYAEIHWRDIEAACDVGFLNIVGEATAAEAPTVLSAVAALRKKSSSYMIKNSVTVETIVLGDIEGASFDSINTWELLSNILKDNHKKRLEELGYVID